MFLRSRDLTFHVAIDGPAGARRDGGQAVAAQVGADDAKAAGQPLCLGLPHPPLGAERMEQEQRGRFRWPVDRDVQRQVLAAQEHLAPPSGQYAAGAACGKVSPLAAFRGIA